LIGCECADIEKLLERIEVGVVVLKLSAETHGIPFRNSLSTFATLPGLRNESLRKLTRSLGTSSIAL